MEQIIVQIALVYLSIMSLIGFVIMGKDKKKAKKRQYRISERTLILIAFLGGGIGSLLGMLTFHHKTKHLKFLILLPITALMYFIIGVNLCTLLL